jgi:hypothetical protein
VTGTFTATFAADNEMLTVGAVAGGVGVGVGVGVGAVATGVCAGAEVPPPPPQAVNAAAMDSKTLRVVQRIDFIFVAPRALHRYRS